MTLRQEAALRVPIGGAIGGIAVLVWWAFFSRVRHAERWGGLLLSDLPCPEALLARDILLVRNGQEMAAFRLLLADE